MAGLRYLGRGHRWVGTHGRWYGFGLLPALVTLLLYTVALVVLAAWADDLAVWATPFAEDWDAFWRSALRVVFVVLLVGLGLLLAALTFTAVTLLVGEPFYERLSEEVEESEGGCPPDPGHSLPRQLWNSLTASVYVLLRALCFTVPLFFLGFVPFVGQTVVPVVTTAVSGFFLTVELTGVAMERRDVPVRERMRLLRERTWLAVGFGVPLALGFLVPLAAIFLMPGAVAGATLLVRDLVPAGPSDAVDARTSPSPGKRAPEGPAAGFGPAPRGPASAVGPTQPAPRSGPWPAPPPGS